MYSIYLSLAVGALVTWLIWTIIYRRFFHPLAKVPGPWLAAVSSLYECYYDLVHKGGGQYPFRLKELHEQYGPIIRPTPHEVHVSDPAFLDTIYALRNRNHPASGGIIPLVRQSVGGAEEFKLHKLRREALNPFFSTKGVIALEPLLSAKRDKVDSLLIEAALHGKPINLSDIFFAFSNDIVRSFSFGSDNDLLGDMREAHRQREDLARLLRDTHLTKHFTLLFQVLSTVLPLLKGEQGIPAGVRDMIAFRAEAGRKIEAVLADKTNDSKGGRSIFYELRDTPLLPPEEKTAGRLRDEATLIVLAGTESTAKSLGIATLYCLLLPAVMSRLRAELEQARGPKHDVKLELSTLLGLPFLNAIIYEANRLSFGVTGRSIRYSPTETLTYTASYGPNNGTVYVLPPGTYMSTVTTCTHLNESLFPDPWRFDPDRWLGGGTEVDRRKRYMHALGKGHRRCLGVNLANAALCLALATIASFEMELFETDESDIKYKYDKQISHPKLESKGIRAIVKGKRQY